MTPTRIKSSVRFSRPFKLTGFNEVLPAGDYDLETEIARPITAVEPQGWKASVMIHLHPKQSIPGLARNLTVPLAELERAVAADKLSGKPLSDLLLDELLADPMVRLVMQSDGVAEDDIRRLFSGRPRAPEGKCDE